MSEQHTIKQLTANTLKWNMIDRVSSQILYAVTGIVLARLLTPEDFGLVGAMMFFQAFATLFVDSGFSYALLQRKTPTETDYSTVLWFNLSIATIIYVVLWAAAPLIAQLFQNDTRLIPMSRVMFLVFIINASSIVQTNRLMKQMNVRMIAIANSIGLIIGGIVGITLALKDYGAWAIVWQTIVLSATKSVLLWLTSHWLPLLQFSFKSLRSIFKVGSAVMTSSFLNVLSQNIYSFFIGNQVGMSSLGYYTQADKWSKMGVASISQVLTSSFLPVLSQFQDDKERFARATAKMNLFTAYFLFPVMLFLIFAAKPIFHLLFEERWDASIPLFQLLIVRGIFVVLASLYNNYILALGKSKLIVTMEIVRDAAIILALLLTLPYIALSTTDNITYGIQIMLWGQVIASALTFIVMVVKMSHVTGREASDYIVDLFPSLFFGAAAFGVATVFSSVMVHPVMQLITQLVIGCAFYAIINSKLKHRWNIQKEVFEYIRYRNFSS